MESKLFMHWKAIDCLNINFGCNFGAILNAHYYLLLCSLQFCLLAWLQMKLPMQISQGDEFSSNNLHVCK